MTPTLSQERRLQGIYAIPNGLRTFEEFQRLHHRDLPIFTRRQLQVERYRLLGRMAAATSARFRIDPWIEDRLDRVEQALNSSRRDA